MFSIQLQNGNSAPHKRTHQLFPKRKTLDTSKLKEFADDNVKFDEN